MFRAFHTVGSDRKIGTESIRRLLLIGIWALIQPGIASGVTIIPNVTATTDMGSLNASTTPDKMVDGSGLTGANFTSYAGTHDAGDATGWKSTVGFTSGTITFDLQGLHLLESLGVWNHPQLDGDRGVRNVVVSTSTDGVVFTDVEGGPTAFAQKTAPVSAQVFDFGDVLATHVRIEVIDGYGAVNTGLSEVRFDAIPVPEPGASVSLAAGFIAVLGHAWRSRLAKASSRTCSAR